mmetsp:Transcript_11427/g.33873  ORF Transcript_11427/g.33873 Transcript_11427/m.33873 type:complete len:201 (+) Transcript_11427:502-1104(+)
MLLGEGHEAGQLLLLCGMIGTWTTLIAHGDLLVVLILVVFILPCVCMLLHFFVPLFVAVVVSTILELSVHGHLLVHLLFEVIASLLPLGLAADHLLPQGRKRVHHCGQFGVVRVLRSQLRGNRCLLARKVGLCLVQSRLAVALQGFRRFYLLGERLVPCQQARHIPESLLLLGVASSAAAEVLDRWWHTSLVNLLVSSLP